MEWEEEKNGKKERKKGVKPSWKKEKIYESMNERKEGKREREREERGREGDR